MSNTNDAVETRIREAKIYSFIAGMTLGSLVVACAKDDSATIRELGKIITSVAGTYACFCIIRRIF